MREMTHRAAATMTLGVLSDDLLGALLDVPPADAGHDDLAAAGSDDRPTASGNAGAGSLSDLIRLLDTAA